MIDFARRSEDKEIMDLKEITGQEAKSVYGLLEKVNRYLGGSDVILNHLKVFAQNWKKGEKIRILDVASGSGDTAAVVLNWARSLDVDVQMVLLDSSASALQIAERRLRSWPEAEFVHASAMELPFTPLSFDYVISSLFFHHLSDEQIISRLKSFDSLARRGILVNDLERAPFAFWGIRLLAALSGNATFRNDAPLSVLRAFRQSELKAYVAHSGLAYLRIFRHYAFRFALCGEKF